MYETKLDNLQLDEKDKIGYVYKCMGSGFWALKQNDFRTALQKLVMEVRFLPPPPPPSSSLSLPLKYKCMDSGFCNDYNN